MVINTILCWSLWGITKVEKWREFNGVLLHCLRPSKERSKTWNADWVWSPLRRERLCNSSLVHQWVPLLYFVFGYSSLVAAVGIIGYPKADHVLSLTIGLLFGALENLRVCQHLKNSGTCEFSQLHEGPCLIFCECNSIALRDILSFNHRYQFADGCKLGLHMLSRLL